MLRTTDASPYFVSTPRRPCLAWPMLHALQRRAEMAVPPSSRREATELPQEDAQKATADSTATLSGAANEERKGGEVDRLCLADHGEATPERGGASSENIVTVVHEHKQQQPTADAAANAVNGAARTGVNEELTHAPNTRHSQQRASSSLSPRRI